MGTNRHLPLGRFSGALARLRPRRADAETTGASRAGLALLNRLYAEQLAAGGTEYLAAHAEPAVARHQVNVFDWYARYLRPETRVLDWGCNHAPDACLVRHRFGDSVDLHTCDFIGPETFPVFRAAARAAHLKIEDPLVLPYPAGGFDAVIGSGVLEHTAMDGEALKQVYRVLRPLGLFVITFLPYRYSWSEWSLRNLRGCDFHRRLYSRSGLATLLKSHGFNPLEIRFHTTLPDPCPAPSRSLWRQVLRPVWKRAIRWFPPAHTTVCCVAQKMITM